MKILAKIWKCIFRTAEALGDIIAGLAAKIPKIFHARSLYENTYTQQTGNSLLSTCRDPGTRGEFLVWTELRGAEYQGAKFLFNVYIPKQNGETSEIDVVMIAPKGIFVFESKNYSGWIFGNPHSPMWTQTLPSGRGRAQKYKFYNPILQNRGHILHLKNILGDIPMYSIICFSDRCEFKNVPTDYSEAKIIKRWMLRRTVTAICQTAPLVFTPEQIEKIYSRLHPYTQLTQGEKAAHIRTISAKYQNTRSPITPNKRFCRICGSQVPSGGRFCPQCGTKN